MFGLCRQTLLRDIFRCGYQFPFKTLTQAANVAETSQEELDKLFKTVEVELRGNDPAVLNSFIKFAKTAGNHLNIQSQTWHLRKPTHTRYTVLKSVHIYKKHRVQYEFRTYYSFISYKHLTESTASTLLEYIQRNLPEGVALKATMSFKNYQNIW
ncbi:28S ribosomal protein S10, mitochondrial isoform X2 [Coccinella septempunctata]|uniref:28S ribosomal protein S10, mitochondrial isoform X2 n=1 Tax=Coccinella septempunctata TaxID=41139 RepID=UPI001D08707F|nr:28S ribosomal protein S10, mitochondrial isoform X2 [Coccinella septempunctata]